MEPLSNVQPGKGGDRHGFRSWIHALLWQPLLELRTRPEAGWIPDLVAGLTVASLAIPQSIAYASIADLPPHYGLNAAVVAALVGALWGSSRYLSMGPTNGASLLVLSILLPIAIPGSSTFLVAASVLAVLVGGFLLAFALLKLGNLVTLASRAVLLGFSGGAAVLIALGQLRHLFRLDIPSSPVIYRVGVGVATHLGEIHWPSLMLGAGTLLVLLLLRTIHRRVPAALLAIALAVVCVWFWDLERLGIGVIGEFPRLLVAPNWAAAGALLDLGMLRSLLFGALAIAALGTVEVAGSAQTLAWQDGERVDFNRECFALGLSNVAAGLLSGYPCSGSFTRSALSRDSGARSRFAGLFAGAGILVGVLLLAPYARAIPRASLAAILLTVAWSMVDRQEIRRVLRTSWSEATVMGITFGATLVLPLEFALLSGILLAVGFFLRESSLPRFYEVVPDESFQHFVQDPDRPTCPQVAIMNIEGPLFFGAVQHLDSVLLDSSASHPGQSLLVLRLHSVVTCDLSGVELLESVVRRYRQVGGDVYLVGPRPAVRRFMVVSGFLGSEFGEDHILPPEQIIEHLFKEVINPAVCIYECEHKVFAECQGLEKCLRCEPVPVFARPDGHALRYLAPREVMSAGLDRFLVLDIREASEYARGHIPGARLLPLRSLLAEGDRLPRDKPLLICCRTNRRSLRAVPILRHLGFNDLGVLRGGILAWRGAGLPQDELDRAPQATGSA